MNKDVEAHFIALKTLRKRCEYLEKRLEFVEQENCQLKLQKVQAKDKVVQSTCDIGSLEKQVILLNNENSKMSHQLEMITSENQTLWAQLNKLMVGINPLEKTFLTSNCDKFGDAKKSNKPSNFTWLESTSTSDDCNNKESLEEISLKLINGILMGKTEIENQYSQMIDLQKETNQVEMKRFSIMPLQFDTRSTVRDLKVSIQKLRDFKECLYQQKIELGNVISHIKSLPKNNQENPQNLDNNPNAMINVFDNEDDISNIQSQERLNGENCNSDYICPICSKVFHEMFTVFYKHVSDHFDDENEEFSSATFEVIP